MLADLPYLAVLAVSLAGLVLVDIRFKLLFWRSPVATSITLLIGVGFFLLWDVVGIWLGVFFRGGATNLSGLLLAPELPVEEPIFLILLCYFTLLSYRLSLRLTQKHVAS